MGMVWVRGSIGREARLLYVQQAVPKLVRRLTSSDCTYEQPCNWPTRQCNTEFVNYIGASSWVHRIYSTDLTSGWQTFIQTSSICSFISISWAS